MAKSKSKSKPVDVDAIGDVPLQEVTVFKVRNNTPYFKVDPETGDRYNGNGTCEVSKISNWLAAQIAAKLFEKLD